LKSLIVQLGKVKGAKLPNISITQLATYAGICVGLAFVSYVVRTLGYFSVVGPEFFPLFIQADLVMGAVLEAPFVISILSAAYLIAAYFTFWEVTFLLWLSGVAAILFLISKFFLEGENFIWIATISLILALFSYMWIFIHYIDQRRLSIVLCFSALMSTNAALTNFGKYQAIDDLNHPRVRYSVTAEDKSYVNVILLRASNSAILLKVGGAVVFYDRSKISKIELAASEMRQY
jgi:hypothetical protein